MTVVHGKIDLSFCPARNDLNLFNIPEQIMATIRVEQSDTIKDIDEALSHIVETFKAFNNKKDLMPIVDGLLDERLEKSCD